MARLPVDQGIGPDELPFDEPVGEPPREPNPYDEPSPAEYPGAPDEPMPSNFPPDALSEDER